MNILTRTYGWILFFAITCLWGLAASEVDAKAMEYTEVYVKSCIVGVMLK